MTHVPTVKNQGMPAYDPRAIKGIGVTYATSTMGADHTSGYAVATNILKVGGDVDPLKPEGQCDLSQALQEATAGFFDSTGLCLFLAFACLDQPDSLAAIPEMVSALCGVEMSVADAVGPRRQGAGDRAGLQPAGRHDPEGRPPAGVLLQGEAAPPQRSSGTCPTRNSTRCAAGAR